MYLYDEAIIRKLETWFNNDHINIRATDTMLEVEADMSYDKLTLPIIGIIKLPTEILNVNKTTRSAEGAKLIYDRDAISVQKLHAIPIRLHYQISFYHKTRRECEELTSEAIFKFINSPKNQIEIPDEKCNIRHNFMMRLGPEWTDNSDLVSHNNTGQLFINTLDLWVDDAYIFRYTIKEQIKKVVIKQIAVDNKVCEEIN